MKLSPTLFLMIPTLAQSQSLRGSSSDIISAPSPNSTDAAEIVQYIPDMSDEDIKAVMNWIKKEVTMVRNPFCWKDSYNRGTGTIPGRLADCPPDYTNDGATCRRATDDILAPSVTPSCPDGYTNTGLTCFQGTHDIPTASTMATCKPGWTNFGATCTMATGTGNCQWYQAWHCDTCGFAEPGCMSCEEGYFRTGGRCYRNCPDGYTNTGEFCHRGPSTLDASHMSCPSGYFLNEWTGRCHQNCPEGYTNTGETCHLPLLVEGLGSMTCKEGEDLIGGRCYPAGGDHQSCFNDQENDAGLCYESCNDGFSGVLNACWQQCDDSQVDCGLGCAKNEVECGMTTANQIIAPVIIALNIYTMGLADAGADAIAAGKTIMVAGKQVAYSSDLGWYALKALDFLQTINKTEQSNPMIIQRIFSAKVGGIVEVRTIRSLSKLSFETQTAMDDYNAYFADRFAEQTSESIARELEDHFHPDTANYLKKVWSTIALQEVAASYGWNVASTSLALSSLADPTGVIAAIEAYAKPVCEANVPFPCTAANLEGSGAC